jgi:mxaJ protein
MSSASRNSLLFTFIIIAASALAVMVLMSAQTARPAPPAAADQAAPPTIRPAADRPTTRMPGVLTVAADPNDLPFSNDKLEGFENKLAQLVADDLGLKLEYVWRASRRGFIRETLKAGEADVVMGVPTSLDMTLNTIPYYRSAYVFVSRTDLSPPIDNFDDPRLRTLKIGVPLTGDSNPPPTYALAERGLVNNVAGYSVWADYSQPNPTAQILHAVTNNEIDVAIAWGPLAGYFAPLENRPLRVTAIQGDPLPGIPFAFNISMGVARGNKVLKGRLDDVLRRHQPDINALLDTYHVPRQTIVARPKDERPEESHTTANPAPPPCDCD